MQISAGMARFRWLFLVIGLAFLAYGGFTAASLSIGGSNLDYFPTNDPRIAGLVEMNKHFGSFETLMIGVEDPTGPLQADALTRLRSMSEKLGKLKSLGVLNVLSFGNVTGMEEGPDGTLHAKPFLQTIPNDEAARKKLAQRTRENTQVYGSLIGAEMNAYLILLAIDSTKDMGRLVAAIQDVMTQDGGPLILHPFGEAFIMPYVNQRMMDTMTLLGPLMALILLGGLWLVTRRVAIMLWVLLASGMVPLAWLALTHLAGLSLTQVHLPALLPIWLVAFLWFTRSAGVAVQARAQKGEAPLLSPAGLLGLLIGFGALIGVSTQLETGLGVALAQALAVGCLAVLLVGLLCFLPLFSWLLDREERRNEALPKAMYESLSGPMTSRPSLGGVSALLIACGLALFALVGASRLHVCLLPEEMFLADEQPAQAVDFFDRLFGGFHVVQVEARADFRKPENARAFWEATEAVKATGLFSDVHGFGEALTFLNGRMNGAPRIPDGEEQLKNLWFFFEGRAELVNLIDDARQRAVIVARVPKRSEARDFEARRVLQNDLQQTLDAFFAAKAETKPQARLVKRVREQMRISGKDEAFQKGVQADRLAPLEDGCFNQDCERSTQAADAAVTALHSYLQSDSSPIEVPDEELPRLADAVREGQHWSDPARVKALVGALVNLPSFRAEEIPLELAQDLATVLAEKAQAAYWLVLSQTGARDLAATYSLDRPREEMLTGILVDYYAEQAGAPIPSTTLRFEPNGFPLRRVVMDDLLMADVHQVVLALAVAALVALLLLFGGVLPFTASLLGLGFIAALPALVLGLGQLGLDPATAPLWMAVPLVGLLLLPTGRWPHGYGACFQRGSAVALMLSFGVLSLCFTGPVTRLAVAAALILLGGMVGSFIHQVLIARSRRA